MGCTDEGDGVYREARPTPTEKDRERAARECPHCGRLVAEQIPGSPILCPTCGATAPNLAAWNRRIDDVGLVVGIARRALEEQENLNAAQKPLDNEPSEPYIEVIRGR